MTLVTLAAYSSKNLAVSHPAEENKDVPRQPYSKDDSDQIQGARGKINLLHAWEEMYGVCLDENELARLKKSDPH